MWLYCWWWWLWLCVLGLEVGRVSFKTILVWYFLVILSEVFCSLATCAESLYFFFGTAYHTFKLYLLVCLFLPLHTYYFPNSQEGLHKEKRTEYIPGLSISLTLPALEPLFRRCWPLLPISFERLSDTLCAKEKGDSLWEEYSLLLGRSHLCAPSAFTHLVWLYAFSISIVIAGHTHTYTPISVCFCLVLNSA